MNSVENSSPRRSPERAREHPVELPPWPADQSLDPLIHDLNVALAIPAFWRATQKLLKKVLPHHSSSLLYGIVNERPKGALHYLSKPWEAYRPADSVSVAGKYLVQHPKIELYTFSQIVAEDPHAYTRHVEQLQGVEATWTEYVHLAFWHANRPDAVLSIRRDGDFSPADLSFLRWLHSLLNSAMCRVRSLENLHACQLGLGQFVNSLPVAVVFLDLDLQVTHSSAEGYEACATWNYGRDGARTINPRQHFRLPQEIARACHQLYTDEQAQAHSPEALTVGGVKVQHPEISDLIARVVLAQPLRHHWVDPSFIVTFSMERNTDGAALLPNRTALKYLQVLSQGERRVALLVAEGLKNRQIADQLGRSRRTIESQLSSVLRKLNLDNRLQLMRALQ